MRHRVTFVCLALVLLVAASAAAEGYVVFFKSGKHVRAREPLKVQGKAALITLVTGTLVSYPVDLIDLVETERYNRLGLGDALLIEELTVETRRGATPTPTPSLGSLATLSGAVPTPDADALPPTPTPTPGIQLQKTRYADAKVDNAFRKIFDEKRLYLFKTSVGTQPEYFFVQAITDEQREVFATLKIVAEAYAGIAKLDPSAAPMAVELEMLTTTKKPAGTFRLTTELAEELATGTKTVEQFYVEHVIF
jgi:hypothetical protein